MTTPSLERLIDYADALPSLPEVVAYLTRALRDENADLETLSRHINSDPAIVARLLAAANAASTGLARRVQSVSQAFLLLGADRVAHIVLASTLIHRYDGNAATGFSAPLLWRHSLGVAVCSRALAEQTGVDPELAFVAGLLHDIGRLLMYVASPAQVLAALDRRQHDDIQLVAAERAVFGYDHCDAGRVLAGAWNLPPEIAEAIAAHHEPDGFGSEICDLVHIAECLSHALDLGEIASNRVPDLSELACAHLGVTWPKFSSRFAEIEARFDDFRLSLGI
ncbi:MAG: HDOD domain-containing protein [Candidatus Accumulibacter sp.]|jgi:putative nucleotidyltransferase with HDIG domain|nr:HDOD domain-containing protein [Accumulibacter sp.]